jgi:hypothetical protein
MMQGELVKCGCGGWAEHFMEGPLVGSERRFRQHIFCKSGDCGIELTFEYYADEVDVAFHKEITSTLAEKWNRAMSRASTTRPADTADMREAFERRMVPNLDLTRDERGDYKYDVTRMAFRDFADGWQAASTTRPSVQLPDKSPESLARHFHDTFEANAITTGWQSQVSETPFAELHKEYVQTMISTVCDVLVPLLQVERAQGFTEGAKSARPAAVITEEMVKAGGRAVAEVWVDDLKILPNFRTYIDLYIPRSKEFSKAALTAALPHAVDESAIREAYEAVLADHRRLVRELDVALFGEEGAAPQASLCDLIGPAKALREQVRREVVEEVLDAYRTKSSGAFEGWLTAQKAICAAAGKGG